METNPRFVGLEQRTRANLEQSALIIKKAKALIERRAAARVNPKFLRVGSAVPKPEIKEVASRDCVGHQGLGYDAEGRDRLNDGRRDTT